MEQDIPAGGTARALQGYFIDKIGKYIDETLKTFGGLFLFIYLWPVCDDPSLDAGLDEDEL